MKNYYLEIAGVKIKIENTNELSNTIAHDLDAKVLNTTEVSFDLILRFNTDNFSEYKPTVYSAKGSMNFNKNEFFVGYLSGIKYKVKNLFNESPTELDIEVNNKNIKTLLRQLYNLDFSNRYKNIILSYSLFWYILHIVLLKQQKAFLHAGVFSKGNKISVITGTGGCGKTSTLFKLLEEENSYYIAEDFGILNNEAETFYNPKPVSIYASDMEFGQTILKNYHQKFTSTEKILWDAKSKFLNKNPMIKALPQKVMDGKIKESGKIDNILYFVRNNSLELSIDNIETDNLAERVLDASMRELKTLNELVLLMRANAPQDYNIPSFEEIRQKTKEVYKKAFENTNNKIVYIPYKTKPDELVNFLKEQGLV
ncbi:DEAD/DEAH box helicase family protein [Aliarcobacter skirrowii]|uniref:hypothetical protein n=1 Tax=Aliarcobacter skirrowii TaxID=28200 RepID=UPI00082EB8CB|nr:hypothetical protein [Aliarcobacter skirrowii]